MPGRRRLDLRHLIDGLQAEYARVPFADTSVYKLPAEVSDEQVIFLSDIIPTAFEVGVLNGRVAPGDTLAVVGAGPVGLAAIFTARLFTPGRIVAIDLADARLESARRFGADTTINNGRDDPVAAVKEITDGLGADVAIEAVGVPATFELCTELIRPGGRVANVGVHGHPATLHLETLWIARRDRDHRPCRYGNDPAAAEPDRRRAARPVSLRDSSLPSRGHDVGLRHLRRCRQHEGSQDSARGRAHEQREVPP